MSIDEELLRLAKRGVVQPVEALTAATTIVRAAWKSAFGAKDSFMREMMATVAEQLVEVATLPQEIVYLDLAEAVRERDNLDSMLELFGHAWAAAHDAYDVVRHTRLMFLVGVLFLMANYRSAASGAKSMS